MLHVCFFFNRLSTMSNTKKSRLEAPSTANSKIAKRNLLVEYNKDADKFVKPKTTAAQRKSPLKRVISLMTQPTAMLRRRVSFQINLLILRDVV